MWLQERTSITHPPPGAASSAPSGTHLETVEEDTIAEEDVELPAPVVDGAAEDPAPNLMVMQETPPMMRTWTPPLGVKIEKLTCDDIHATHTRRPPDRL